MADAPSESPASKPETRPTIGIEEFAKIDLRVARIVHAEDHPSADKLLKLRVDDGSGTPRQICAGIKSAYKPEELVGKLIVIVANLAPRMLRGEESRGMLLAASSMPKDAPGADAERRVVLITPMGEATPGSVVS